MASRASWPAPSTGSRPSPGPRDGTALITETDRPTRWTRTSLLYPGGGDTRRLFDRSAEDVYGAPGFPLRRPGGGVASATILQDGDAIYLAGAGASPDGDRPFVDRLDLRTLDSERLFHTEPGSYETVVAVLGPDGGSLLTRRESSTGPAQLLRARHRQRGGARADGLPGSGAHPPPHPEAARDLRA